MTKLKKAVGKEGGNSNLCNQTATFVVKILYSKNNSIQGYLHWLENEKSVPFRSFMEMTQLINDALTSTEVVSFRSWDKAKHMIKDVKR